MPPPDPAALGHPRADRPAPQRIAASARLAANRLVNRLPGPARTRVRQTFHALRGVRGAPAQREVKYPFDISDREELRTFLQDSPIFGDAWMERQAYIDDALDRFRVTMSLVPELPPGARVLELGADPYFLTRLLLHRDLDVTCANWFGDGVRTRRTAVIGRKDDGTDQVVEYDSFNVEEDRFPYEDDSFDLLLCCEILEHLPADPIHMLAEIHRVLRNDTGVLILTTPNAVRMVQLLRMLRGENVYEQYSSYGAYGRHNREYTVEELRRLLAEAGYTVRDVFALDVHPEQPDTLPLMGQVTLADRGDNLFALASPIGNQRWSYMDWLYMSTHAVKPRVTRPDVVMGENGYVQAQGLYSLEQVGGEWVRWTGYGPHATVMVDLPEGGPSTLLIRGLAAPPAAGEDLTLHAAIGGDEHSWRLTNDGTPFTVSAPVTVGNGRQDVRLWTDRTFVPRDVGIGEDRRTLGVGLVEVSLKPD